jgi:hypothetical protein
MELIALVMLAVVGGAVALVGWLIARANDARRRIDELSRHLDALELEILRLKREKETAPAIQPAPAVQAKVAVAPPIVAPPPVVIPPGPVIPPEPVILPGPVVAPEPVISRLPTFIKPSPIAPMEPMASTPPPISTPPPKPAPAINWEQFMGVKGFAWVGGLALFLGLAFFVKYSFDKNLIPPELRVAIGFLAGLGLLVGGVILSRKNYPTHSQTLCATGILTLYAVTFACRSFYHFEFFGLVPTFLLMALITTTAFFLAVRLEGLVVAILGMLGGFLTPVLLSTGVDNPAGLFGYIAILDAGLMVVALHRRWDFLTALAAWGTAVMQIAWAGEFFVKEKYFEGGKILIALAVLLGFNALWLAASGWAKRRGQVNPWLSGSALGLVFVALAFTAWFLDFAPLAQRPWLMFGFVFLVDLVAVALAWLDNRLAAAQAVSGFAVFGLLALWTSESLTNELLNAALAFYFLFAVLHSAWPALLRRRRGASAQNWAIHVFPLLALGLALVPVFKLAEVFIVWPFVLLVDVLAIALAVLTATLLPVLAALLLTLAALGALIFKIPSNLTGLPVSFFLLGAFAVFFVAAGVWLVKRFKPEALRTGARFGGAPAAPGDVAAMLPACSVVLPFTLLIMATLRLPLTNPSPVFGLALLLVALLLGVTKLFALDWMPAIGLACVTSLECAWHFNHFDPANPQQAPHLVLGWYLIFFAAFALFPFLFLRQFENKTVPWAAAAMAGPLQFFLIHRLVKAVYPNASFMGLLPAAFALPGLLSLAVVLKKMAVENKFRMTQLAWFGGVALFFITLIFPIQFERQWITIGWALEGAALLWLFHRVPHPGLRLAGAGLLGAAFVRLALNPAVLEYHRRAATPILNWYLYAYGVAAVCLFAGAKLLAPPRAMIAKINAPPILAGLGVVLAFLLLNIEIADYFSLPGATLTFQFSGSFERDMTYSIAWALFALALLVHGIVQRIPAGRYAAMGLLCVTLLKLFFHDLARLDQLSRIGAFIGVAVIVMLASFAYQKFFAAGGREKEGQNATPP